MRLAVSVGASVRLLKATKPEVNVTAASELMEIDEVLAVNTPVGLTAIAAIPAVGLMVSVRPVASPRNRPPFKMVMLVMVALKLKVMVWPLLIVTASVVVGMVLLHVVQEPGADHSPDPVDAQLKA